MQVLGEGFVRIRPDLSKFDSDLTAGVRKAVVPAADQAGKDFSTEFAKQGEPAGRAAGVNISKGLKTALAAGLGTISALAIRNVLSDIGAEAAEAQRVGAQTEAVLKSTGAQAGVTADSISELSGAISEKTAIDDEQIQSAANMVLTFKNVRNEAGKNNDIFDQSVTVAVDMAAAMAAVSGGQIDLRSASIQLGKALNDPVKGITALTRVGVTFDEQQKERIKRFVEEGNVVGAQKIILAELRSEFEGSAAAQATAGDRLKVAIANVEETLGTILLPVIEKVVGALSFVADGFLGLPSPIQEAITWITLGGGALLGIIKVIEKVHAIQEVVTTMGALGNVMKIAGEGALVAAVGVASFVGTLELLKALQGESVGEQAENQLAKVQTRIESLAKVADGKLLDAFDKTVKLQTATKKAVNELNGFDGAPNVVIGSKLVERLTVFRTLAEQDYDAAVRLTQQMKNAGRDTTVYEQILAKLAPTQQTNTKATEQSIDQIQALGGTLDVTSDRFKNSVAVFGTWGTKVAVSIGIPVEKLDEMASQVESFSKTLESSVSSTTNPFSKFGKDAEVSTEAFEQFLVGSQLAVVTWSQTVTDLIRQGVDVGMVEKIAQAGPASQPALDAFVRVVDEKGVEWVNSVIHSSDEVVKQTEAAYQQVVVTTAVKEAERLALTQAVQQAIVDGNNTALFKLVTSTDSELSKMAQTAIGHLNAIKSGVESIPTEWGVDIQVRIAAMFTGQKGDALSELAALGGGDAIAQQLFDFLNSLPQGMAGGSWTGWGIVGEAGPELVNFGQRGGTVFPNDVTRQILGTQPVIQQTDAGPRVVDNSVSFGAVTLPIQRSESDAVDELFRKVDRTRFLAGLG